MGVYAVVWGSSRSFPEEEVRLVKQCMGRSTTKSVLHRVAASIDACSFWSQLLSEFIDKAPTLRERAPWLQKHSDELAKVTEASPACVEVLTSATVALADLQKEVRKRTFERFQSLVKEKLALVCKMIGDDQGMLSREEIASVVKLLTEAITAFPLDESLQSSLEQAGVKLASLDKEEVMQGLLSLCEPCLEEGLDPVSLGKKVEIMAAKLGTIKVPQDLIESKCGATFMKVVEACFACIDASWNVKDDAPDYAFTLCHGVDMVCESFPKELAAKSKVEVYKDALFLVQGSHYLSLKTEQPEDDKGVEESILVLQKRLAKFKASMKEKGEQAQGACSKAVLARGRHLLEAGS